MQLNATQHAVTKQAAQERQRGVLVHVVHATQGGAFAQLLQQVAQVVQQAGGDQLVVGAVVFGQRGGLQRVFELGDGLAAVLLVATPFEHGGDV